MAVVTSLLSVLSLITYVVANVEKTIFLAPELVNNPLAHSTFSNLRLDTLTPANGALRTQLTARFPSSEHPRGTATWLVVDKLTPNQRYEVRVCWPAVQPTDFTLETFPFSTVQDSPDLLSSLHAYSASRQSGSALADPDREGEDSSSSNTLTRPDAEASVLLLRILAAADYFTTDASLMREVPPVDVDIILDPFLLNVLPRSIAGTAAYIVAVAVVSFLLAGRIVSWIKALIAAGHPRQGGTRSMKKRQ